MDNSIKIHNIRTYLGKHLEQEMDDFLKAAKTKSGYSNIDSITTIYPGLYVLGAISSLGKTTFVHQMCDQMAENGEHIIYFSFEQNTLELVTKSLSRIIAKRNPQAALTSLQIRKNGKDERILNAITEYQKYANNITIVECGFRATIEDIEQYVKEYIDSMNIKPVIVVDYLQVIQAPPNNRMTTKDLVDSNVRRLKRLQVENNIVLILISSLNRQNYLNLIDFESFKESGGIEYTADVIWGLQLSILHDELFDTQANINEKRQKIKEAKASIPRMIELVCLKNRFGISSYSCIFKYLPQFDWFQPFMRQSPTDATKMDPDGFSTLPVEFKTPFD